MLKPLLCLPAYKENGEENFEKVVGDLKNMFDAIHQHRPHCKKLMCEFVFVREPNCKKIEEAEHYDKCKNRIRQAGHDEIFNVIGSVSSELKGKPHDGSKLVARLHYEPMLFSAQ